MDNIDILWQLCSRLRPKVQLRFLLTGYEIKEYNIHVICKLLKFSVHQTRLLKVLVMCLLVGFVISKRCSLLG